MATTISNSIDIPDNGKLLIGDSDDLQIYHDGSHSYIKDTGTGDLYIEASDDLILKATDSNELIRCNANSSVQLYHNGSEKLETTSTGIDVTGTATVSSHITSTGGQLFLSQAGTNYINAKTAFNMRFSDSSNPAYESILYAEKDSFVKLMHNGLEKIATTYTGVNVTGSVTVGDGHTIGDDVDDNLEIKSSSGEAIMIDSADKVYLRNSGVTKLKTTSSGIDVTGSVTADSLTVGEAGSDYAIMIKEGSGGEYYQLGVDSYGGLVFYNETSKVAEFTDASTFITQGDTTVNGNIICNQPDNGGSPAMTATINMHGYEGRGVGIKMKDSVNSASGASDREWFVGTGYNYSGFNIGYSSSGSESSYSAQTKLRVSSGGDVQVDTGNLVIGTAGKGIDFSAQTASTSGTTTAELLDHYEEGTWTPVFNNADTAAGTYTKIGNFVFCTGKISTSGGTAGSAITGMPFAPMGGTGERGGGSVIYQSHESYAWNAIVNDSSQVTFYKGASGMTDLADGVACYFEISYRTTA